MIVLAAIWFFCGFLAYGLSKGIYKKYYERKKIRGYGHLQETDCRLNLPLGILALAMVCLCNLREPWGFCLKMPEEFKKK